MEQIRAALLQLLQRDPVEQRLRVDLGQELSRLHRIAPAHVNRPQRSGAVAEEDRVLLPIDELPGDDGLALDRTELGDHRAESDLRRLQQIGREHLLLVRQQEAAEHGERRDRGQGCPCAGAHHHRTSVRDHAPPR